MRDLLESYSIAGLIVLAVVLLVWAFLSPEPKSDAMKVCELSHSHDVCFQALNR